MLRRPAPRRLRADLAAVFPAALAFAGQDLGSPVSLKLLHRSPTAEALAAAGRDEVEALARSAKHGWPGRFAERVIQALAGEHFQPRDYLVRAKAGTIRLGCAQLLLLREQRRVWQRRMGELLLGARRQGPANQPGHDRGPAVPGGETCLSFPGLADRLAARIAGEIADAIGQFDTERAAMPHRQGPGHPPGCPSRGEAAQQRPAR